MATRPRQRVHWKSAIKERPEHFGPRASQGKMDSNKHATNQLQFAVPWRCVCRLKHYPCTHDEILVLQKQVYSLFLWPERSEWFTPGIKIASTRVNTSTSRQLAFACSTLRREWFGRYLRRLDLESGQSSCLFLSWGKSRMRWTSSSLQRRHRRWPWAPGCDKGTTGYP